MRSIRLLGRSLVTCLMALAISVSGIVTAVEAGEVFATNDNFVDAIEITELPYPARPTGVIATTEADETICGAVPIAEKSVWYKFAPADDTDLKVDGSSSVAVAAYTGTSSPTSRQSVVRGTHRYT